MLASEGERKMEKAKAYKGFDRVTEDYDWSKYDSGSTAGSSEENPYNGIPFWAIIFAGELAKIYYPPAREEAQDFGEYLRRWKGVLTREEFRELYEDVY